MSSFKEAFLLQLYYIGPGIIFTNNILFQEKINNLIVIGGA